MDQEHTDGQRFEGLELLERLVFLRLGIRPDNSACLVGHDRAKFVQPRLPTAVDLGIEYIVGRHRALLDEFALRVEGGNLVRSAITKRLSSCTASFSCSITLA